MPKGSQNGSQNLFKSVKIPEKRHAKNDARILCKNKCRNELQRYQKWAPGGKEDKPPRLALLASFLACLFSGLFGVFHGFGLPFGLPFGIIFHIFGMPFSSLDFASIPSRFLIVFYLSETTFFTIKQVVLSVSAFFGNI